MRVVFVPEGGFHKAGAFVELGDRQTISKDTARYEREGYLNVSLKCTDVRHQWVVGASTGLSALETGDPLAKPPHRVISAIGQIDESRWGRFNLSILGQEETHDCLNVSIHDGGEFEHVSAGGFSGITDLDLSIGESFFVEVHLPKSSFDALLHQLSYTDTELAVHVRLSAFPRFYSTWSPSIDEGRTIKFLEDTRDVENADAIPDAFWNSDYHKEALAKQERSPVSIYARRQVSSARTSVDEAKQPEHRVIPPSNIRENESSAADRSHRALASIARTVKWVVLGQVIVALAVLLSGH